MAKKLTGTQTKAGPQPAELLSALIGECYPGILERAKEDTKLGDWLKMIELHRKIAPQDASQKQLWNHLEKIRRELLGKKKISRARRPDGVEQSENKN
ncbi:MAG: hypothetical protein ABIK07_07190 [Planctomycetota bacterium]